MPTLIDTDACGCARIDRGTGLFLFPGIGVTFSERQSQMYKLRYFEVFGVAFILIHTVNIGVR